MASKKLKATHPHTDTDDLILQREALTREFQRSEHRSGKRTASGLCILFGFFALAALILYAFLSASHTAAGQLILPAEFPLIAIATAAGYAILSALTVLLASRADFNRFMKERAETATDSSAIRLFKEEIDLPYVVTDNSGKIIVANRAFEDAVAGKHSAVGEDIRDLTSTAIDRIIRVTTAESETDQKLRDIHAAAVRAYPEVLRKTTTADACLALLREIDDATHAPSATPSDIPDPTLLRIHEIASSAFREAEKRSGLWNLCLTTLESILTSRAPDGHEREKLSYIYELTREAYHLALEKENETLRKNALREFVVSLRKIVSVAESDPSLGQLASATRLRLEMFEGRNLLPHMRTLLLNIRQILAEALPDPTVVTDDKDTVTLQTLLRLTDEGIESLRKGGDRGTDDRTFATETLTSILSVAGSAESDSLSRAFPAIRGIADAALCSLLPERAEEYVSLVTREILNATAEKREASLAEDEIRRIAGSMKEAVRNGNREDEERFIAAFRDALRRIVEESRFGLERESSEADRIRRIVESEVSGAISFLEIRTQGVATISSLIKYAEETLTLRDIGKSEQKLVSGAITTLSSLKSELLSVSAVTPASADAHAGRIAKVLSDLLTRFDDKADFSRRVDGSEDEHSASTRVRILYARIEAAAAAHFPLTAEELARSFLDRAPIEVMGYRLYDTMIRENEQLLAEAVTTEAIPPECLPEISDRAYARAYWERSSILLLLYVGLFRVYSAKHPLGSLSELERTAENVFEKLITRRILTEALVSASESAIDASEKEGASDEALYKIAASHFRKATTQRSQILYTASKEIAALVVSFLENAVDTASVDPDGDEDAFRALSTELSRAHARLLPHASATSRPEESVALAVEIFDACAAALAPYAKQESPAAVFHAMLTYLAEFFGDLTGRLLRRELFRTYRDTSLSILSALYRAEYTKTALREIGEISEKVLRSGGDRSVTFAGMTVEDCCSASLRTIAGLAGDDALKELSELADNHAEEALTAKSLWELRKETLARIEGRITLAEERSVFHDARLVPRRNEIARLRKIAEETLTIPRTDTVEADGAAGTATPERRASLQNEALDLLQSLSDARRPAAEQSSVEALFYQHVDAVLSKANSSFVDFLNAFTEFYALLNAIGADTLSTRRNKKRIQLLRRALSEEHSVSFDPKTGAPLSRVSVAELFREYLNATLRTVRPVHENDALMDDVFHAVSATLEKIDNDASPQFRLYAASSLLRVARTIRRDFGTELYDKIMPPLAEFFESAAAAVRNPAECRTQDSVFLTCTAVFREADALYRIGEIANDSLKILTRFSDVTTVPPAQDLKRIYTTVTEISHKIDTCLQTVPRHGRSVGHLRRMASFKAELYKKRPDLEKSHYTGDDYRDMLSFLRDVSELASPYLLLIDNRDAVAFRAEVSRIRRSVRELSEASALTGSRSTATSMLAAIGQYAHTFENESVVISITESATERIAAIGDGVSAPEEIYAVATSALSEIIARSASEEIRACASEIHADLSERKMMYHFLVTAPIEKLSATFSDPTDPKIYPAAAEIYHRVETLSPRFRAELMLSSLRDSLSSLRSLSDSGSISRIRAICDALLRALTEFESDIRGLPLNEKESFVPPAIRAKQKNLRSWLERLFDFSKRAVAEAREDPERMKLADRITLTVYKGISAFDEISASKEEGAMNRLSAVCREIVEDTLSALRATMLAEESLAEIRRTADTLYTSLTLPAVLDDSVTPEEYDVLFDHLMRRARRELSRIPESVARFREETEETSMGRTVGALSVFRCETVARSALSEIARRRSSAEKLSSDSLSVAVAGLLALRAEHHGKPEEVGVIAVYDKNGRPSGRNNTEIRSSRKRRDSFVPIRKNDEETYKEHGLMIAPASVTSGVSVTLGGRRYVAKSHAHRAGDRDYYLVTFTAVEELLSLKATCEDDNTVVALITLDNLEELAQYVRIDYREAEKDVEKALRSWAGEIHGIFHEYERDKYILFFSQKEMADLVNSKFSDILTALENIRLGDSSVSVTISMGISALGNTLTVKEQNASAALDMALKRGGAQIVIFRDAESQEDRYEFFSGNRVKGLQKENRVGARVVSNYLCELIRKAGDVLVMGHAYPDFDSIGSCVGIAALARHYKKDVHIVVNRHAQNFIDCTPDLLTLPEYRSIFVDGTTGMELKGTDTLLVLCDVSNTNIMEYVDIARTSFNTVIIDHHFKTTDSDDLKTLLTYIDPSASSASELVAEILEEALPKDALQKEEANVLLSGIMVDTKNFTRSVGARTFAAALYLRKMGANAEISSTYFYEESGDYKAEVVFRKNLEFHRGHKEVAITYCSPEDIADNPEVARCDLRVAASKAADKLLTVRGVSASFALYPYSAGGRSGVAISGRSDGSINVQQILEAFHGGGHFDSAGATLPGEAIETVIASLAEVIDRYFSEISEEDDGEDGKE